MPDWSPQQDAALKAVSEWLSNPGGQQLFYLAGFAGTGKTTLAKHLAEGVDGTVLFAAYTGKAAHVLRRKGCLNATTLHSLMYLTREQGRTKELAMKAELERIAQDPSQKPRIDELLKLIEEEETRPHGPVFTWNPESPIREAALLVVDECSMVGREMGEDVLRYGTPVLVLGDPAQLPPVKEEGFFTARDPDFLLTEVHRQAQESPILWLANLVRKGGLPPVGTHGNGLLRVVPKGTKFTEEVMEADQVLVGKNATRHVSNARYRQIRGCVDPHPLPGDKLVCLRNNHDLGLLNGSLWRVHQSVTDLPSMRVMMVVSSEEDTSLHGIEVEAHAHHFLGRETELKWYEKREADEFTYGYALTVHKSQGSQWDDVVLIDESWVFRQDRSKWLYTGITRAAEKLLVVLQ